MKSLEVKLCTGFNISINRKNAQSCIDCFGVFSEYLVNVDWMQSKSID